MELNTATAGAWLKNHLGVAISSVQPLSGGVSSTVLLATTPEHHRIVVKQALPQLRVDAEWLCDRRRALLEAAALRTLQNILEPGTTPELLAEDRDHYVFAMSAAPADAETWKARLLRGECDGPVARAAGDALARLIDRTAERPQPEFADVSIFDDLRLDAYYRYTSERHPDLRAYYHSLIDDCLHRRHSLVHGDFSPKNMLTDGKSAMIIDWECVHYGNPAFDAAFLLNHLLLKSFHLPEQARAFAVLADDFQQPLTSTPSWFFESTLRHWPGLLLARIDGKSPVEYIRDEMLRSSIREFARDLIARPASSVSEVFERRMKW